MLDVRCSMFILFQSLLGKNNLVLIGEHLHPNPPSLKGEGIFRLSENLKRAISLEFWVTNGRVYQQRHFMGTEASGCLPLYCLLSHF